MADYSANDVNRAAVEIAAAKGYSAEHAWEWENAARAVLDHLSARGCLIPPPPKRWTAGRHDGHSDVEDGGHVKAEVYGHDHPELAKRIASLLNGDDELQLHARELTDFVDHLTHLAWDSDGVRARTNNLRAALDAMESQ